MMMGHMLVVVLFLSLCTFAEKMTTSAQHLLVFLLKKTKRTMMGYMLIIIVQFLFFCHLVEKMMMNMQFIIIYYKKNLHLARTKGQQWIACSLSSFLFWSIYPIVKKMTTSVQLVIVFFSFWSIYTIVEKMMMSMQHV